MKGFRNRSMSKIDFADARELLKAKANPDKNNFRLTIDARSVINKRNDFRPKLDFTIPTKTINNNIFKKKTPESGNFSIKKTNDLSLRSSRTPTPSFSDPKLSQGIFSRSREISSPLKRKTVDTRSARPIVNPKRNSNEIRDQNDYQKRSRVDNIETIKFTVVNEEKLNRPALTTSQFNCHKSLISPIQGYRIEVKNLHPQVSVDDVYELFTSLNGDLRSCNLVRPGYAEVVFRTLLDAQKSIEEFHGRELDGKPMNLKLVTLAQEPSVQNIDVSIRDKIAKMQANRRPQFNSAINKDAIYRSMYLKSGDVSLSSRKQFKFAVTL